MLWANFERLEKCSFSTKKNKAFMSFLLHQKIGFSHKRKPVKQRFLRFGQLDVVRRCHGRSDLSLNVSGKRLYKQPSSNQHWLTCLQSWACWDRLPEQPEQTEESCSSPAPRSNQGRKKNCGSAPPPCRTALQDRAAIDPFFTDRWGKPNKTKKVAKLLAETCSRPTETQARLVSLL